MKIIVKTLSGQNFGLDIELTDTVLQIKEKIKEVKEHEVSQQKLLRKGTLLDDKSTVADIGIQEGEFLVVMVNAKKPAQQVPPPVQQPVPVQQPAYQQPAQQPVQPLVQPTGPIDISGASQLVAGTEFEAAITNMISMGFPREECVAAMKAAFNNPERAIDYLLNGIPQGLTQPPLGNPPPHPQPPSTGPPQQPLGGGLGGVGGVGGLGALGGAGVQLRQLFQQNPQAAMQILPQLMQQIQQTNPQLYQQIQQNPEAMLQLLMGGGGNAPQVPSPNSILLTPEEVQSIETIMAMGFSKQDSAEAFLACDKNVEIALNYLFEKQARGDLLSQHMQREHDNPDPNHEHEGHGDMDDEEDDDGDVYQ